MGKLILDLVIGTFSYLLFVGRADVEAGHNDSCPWHQVEFGVGGPIVSRPEGRETNKALKKKMNKKNRSNKLYSGKDLDNIVVKLQQVPFH